MVIFNSYVSLPEGTCPVAGLNILNHQNKVDWLVSYPGWWYTYPSEK